MAEFGPKSGAVAQTCAGHRLAQLEVGAPLTPESPSEVRQLRQLRQPLESHESLQPSAEGARQPRQPAVGGCGGVGARAEPAAESKEGEQPEAVTRSWRAGPYTCTLTIPRNHPSIVRSASLEWKPCRPIRLSGSDLAEYRRGRDAALRSLGVPVLVLEV